MKLIVVTPTLGRSPHMTEAVASVWSQPLQLRHVIVCPEAAVEEQRRSFPRSEVVAEPPGSGGMYAALNKALAAFPDWDWFTYLNDDDTLQPAFATVATTHCVDDAQNVIAYGDVRGVDERGRSIALLPLEKNPRWLHSLFAAGINPVLQPGSLTSRRVFDRLRGFQQGYTLSADMDFWMRAEASGFGFRYYPVEVARFRVWSGQLSGNQHAMRSEARTIQAAVTGGSEAPLRRVLAVARYRLLNSPRYALRFLRTGRLSGAALLARRGSP